MRRRSALSWLAVLLYVAGCLAVPATALAAALAAPDGCGCDGADADCCGSACCAPAAPSCCGGGAPADPAARIWTARCTCGGHDSPAPAHLALDLHEPAPPACGPAAPGAAPFDPHPAVSPPLHASAPDDPVPRSRA